MTSRIGILGGTFDPVHNAHLEIAQKGKDIFNLKKIYFLLTITPPHKESKPSASALDRFAMLVLATIDYDGFIPYTLKGSLQNGEYTIYMLDNFCNELSLKRDEIIFLAGGDSFRDIHTWKEYRLLLSRYKFIFFDRKGVSYKTPSKKLIEDGTVEDCRKIKTPVLTKFFTQNKKSMLVDLDLPDISSTSVRVMLKSKRDCSKILHPKVVQYISKTGLYGGKWKKH